MLIIAAKIASAAWMLAALFFCIRMLVVGVTAGRYGPFEGTFAAVFLWLMIGFLPVATAKFAWSFIN